MSKAEEHVFGLALFNDWTSRDIQPWEYQPLGPFLSKNFASTVSPWMVTLDALAPFRSAFVRPEWRSGSPALSGLDREPSRAVRSTSTGGLAPDLADAREQARRRPPDDLELPRRLLDAGAAGCASHGQRLQSSVGRSVRVWHPVGPGGPQAGSLLELTQGGKQPITLSNGETRGFLEDGDTVILRGRCRRDGFRTIGFGDCRGTVLPARPRS